MYALFLKGVGWGKLIAGIQICAPSKGNGIDSGIAMVFEETKGSFMKEMFLSSSVKLETKNYFCCHQRNEM